MSDSLSSLLKGVSRSFYLTLRVLPSSVRPQISLAYLLARASDTIADTDAVPKNLRLVELEKFLARIQGAKPVSTAWHEFAGRQTSFSEKLLLEQLDQILSLLDRTDQEDRIKIQTVIEVIISGQILDVARFAEATAEEPIALQTDEELDDYTYRVAGCVGEFWTKICQAHAFGAAHVMDKRLLEDSIRFGKGLQRVNILRDLPVDLRLGRCYIPAKQLEEVALQPQDLLNPDNFSRFIDLYRKHLEIAEGHLHAGWIYTNRLPFKSWRIRLACAWPILIGVKTLKKLQTSNVLNPKERIKISRKDVRNTLLSSMLLYPWPTRWRALWEIENKPR